jgi:hypothetical protein
MSVHYFGKVFHHCIRNTMCIFFVSMKCYFVLVVFQQLYVLFNRCCQFCSPNIYSSIGQIKDVVSGVIIISCVMLHATCFLPHASCLMLPLPTKVSSFISPDHSKFHVPVYRVWSSGNFRYADWVLLQSEFFQLFPVHNPVNRHACAGCYSVT